MTRKDNPARSTDRGYKVIPVYNELSGTGSGDNSPDSDAVIMDTLVLRGGRLKKITPVKKSAGPGKPARREQDRGKPVSMKTAMLTRRGVKTISPISTHGCYADLLLENRKKRGYEQAAAGKHAPRFLTAVMNTVKTLVPGPHDKSGSFPMFTLRKWAREVLFIVAVAFIAGLLSVFIDAKTNTVTRDVLMDRFDRLIRAVEMDWGR